MIEYIQIIYTLLFWLFYILFFSYLYIPLFNRCNIKKKVKKNGKIKIISQPNSILAFIYLILLYFLFKCFTFKIILFIVISLIICALFCMDTFLGNLNENLYKYNKSSLMIVCWKLLHTIFTVINIFTQPLFSVISNEIKNKYNYAIYLINTIANIDNTDNSDNSDNLNKELIKKKSVEQSNMSDYICKSQSKSKSKSKYIKNEKNIELNDKNKESNIEEKDTDLNSKNKELNIDKLFDSINLNDMGKFKKNQDKNSSSSKCVMEKKIEKINKLFDESNSECIEDMTLTFNDETNN